MGDTLMGDTMTIVSSQSARTSVGVEASARRVNPPGVATSTKPGWPAAAEQTGGVVGGVVSADQRQSGDTADDTAMPENNEKSPVRLNLTELSVTPTGLEPVSPP